MTNFEKMAVEAIATKKEYGADFVACFLMTDENGTETGRKVVCLPEWMEVLAPSAWHEAIYDLYQDDGKLLWIGNEPFLEEE